jgi:hypothetical protein
MKWAGIITEALMFHDAELHVIGRIYVGISISAVTSVCRGHIYPLLCLSLYRFLIRFF